MESFQAFRVEETESGIQQSVQTLTLADLPANQVTIQVAYSSLNYKDALSATGNKGVTRSYPHTPGIDAAGIVVASEDERFQKGDEVIVTSYDLGMNTAGGFGGYIRVPAAWVVPLPAGLSLRESMILGTAGFTAALALDALEQQGLSSGSVAVTGASGGVGSVAVALLAKAGYRVLASTGKESSQQLLKDLGADTILARADLASANERPMLKPQFAGAIDTVGGTTLENLIKQLEPHASVAACGLVGGTNLNLTVFPFILRGVNLLGVDSQSCPMPKRQRIWQKLATDWKLDLEKLTREIGLEGLPEAIKAILAGETTGRILVKHSES